MSSINKALLVGRLTADPELRHTRGGTAVCDLRIAVNSREKDSSGEWGERADFFDVTVWGNQAEACAQYLTRGRQVAIAGRLRQERWETEANEKRSKVKIVAETVMFLGGDGEGGEGEGGQQRTRSSTSQDDFAAPPADDDIPF